MIVTVDPQQPTPPYEQLRAQIETMISAGVLAAGTRLPPVRQLAGDLGLAAGTVARAYRELEMAGRVVTRGRHGTSVAEQSRPRRLDADRLAAAADRFVVEALQLGAESEEVVAAVNGAIERTGAGTDGR